MKRLLQLVLGSTALVATSYVLAAGSVAATAKKEYLNCLRETERARRECTFGGCGNILVSCYEREIAVIETDSEKLAQSLQMKSCASQALQLISNFDSLEAANSKFSLLRGSWSELDLKVQTALLKNQALQAFSKECVK